MPINKTTPISAKKLRPFALGAAALVLSACTAMNVEQGTTGAQSQDNVVENSWICPAGRVFTATTPEKLELTYKKETYTLLPSVSASGAKYETQEEPKVIFWSKADEAFFQISEQVLGPCQLAGQAFSELGSDSELQTVQTKLEAAEWQVQTLNGNQVPEGIMRFQFKEGRMTGLAACNRFFGGYELKSPQNVSFSQMGATKMMCDPQKMTLEQAFFELLSDAAHISFGDDGSLIIHGAADRVLEAIQQ